MDAQLHAGFWRVPLGARCRTRRLFLNEDQPAKQKKKKKKETCTSRCLSTHKSFFFFFVSEGVGGGVSSTQLTLDNWAPCAQIKDNQ